MAITTYTELQTAITGWMQDTSLASAAPDFITLAEAEFNRLLRVPSMEAVTTITADAESEALPNDFLQAKAATLLTNPQSVLGSVSLSTLKSLYGATPGKPINFALADDLMWFGPAPDSTYTVQLIYWQKIPALSGSNTTNWLLTRHPDLYLFASLMQAEFYGWNDGRLGAVKGRVDEIISQIMDEAKRQSSPSRMVLQSGIRGG